MSFIVSIIGKPNVGKSTIFNRLIKSDKAIVQDTPGVTRDRLYDKVEYQNKFFNIVDTGGITLNEDDFSHDIKMQAEIAMEESDLILFVVDARHEITPEDELVSEILRQSNQQVIIVANKVDNPQIRDNLYNFYSLGYETIIGVSSLHGNGMYDILDEVYPLITDEEEIEEDAIKFSLIGMPNVGKSSLFNLMLNADRSIVSTIEGTTRDAIDVDFIENGQKYKIIDTAGIRRRGKVYEKVEKYSVLRAIRSIENSDVILWLIDADRGIVEQDKKVLGYALDQRKPVIIVVNKWDLVTKETNTQKLYEKHLKERMPFVADSKMLFVSVKNKKGLKNIMPSIDDLYAKYTKEFTTSQVNNVLADAITSKVPPSYKGKVIKIYYATQIGTKPPRFLFFVNNKEIIHFSYKRYLENQFKKAFGLEGIKLKFQFQNKNEKKDQ